MKHIFIALLAAASLSCGDNSESQKEDTISKNQPEVVSTENITSKNELTNKEDSLLGEIEQDFVSTLPLMEHVWEGYQLIDTFGGDLNNDSKKDYIMVLKKPNEAKTSDVTENPTLRPLLILTQHNNGEFIMETTNDKTVLCVNCGGSMGDPFMGVTIKENQFSVEHHGGSRYQWSRNITFKYDVTKKGWLLYKDDYESIDIHNIESEGTKNIKTAKDFGVVYFDAFNVYQE